MLHIGGVRTALYDWLLARKTGGQFVLRIEDTDRARYEAEALSSIMESLKWLGLDWDEGPDIGGPHAPYTQSERLEAYKAATQQLLDSGDAYEDDTTPEELEELRVRQKAAGKPPGYDNRGRYKTPEQIEESRAKGLPIVVRMKVPDQGTLKFNDAVRGDVEFDFSLLQDFVIMKSDGYPTYHLAHVVDDHEMQISHVIRGEEWIPSTPRHILIHQALGWESPVYVHVPLILGKDKSKLSKRHGAASALEYRDQGYLPEAVFNFLALLGWSPGDDTEVMSRDEIVERFSIERILQHPAVFDADKLLWMNGVLIRQMPISDLLERVIPILERQEAEGGLPDTTARPIDRDFLLTLLPLIQERIKTLNEVVGSLGFFFAEEVTPDVEALPGRKSDPATAARSLEASLELLKSAEPFDPEHLEAEFRKLAEKLELKPGPLFTPVRIAVTGSQMAPPLFDTIAAIGRERVIERIENAIQLLEAHVSGTGA
jgi:glutamyl-tRNA synthetase